MTIIITDANLFALATRNQLRFASARNDLTVEDLWTLPLKHDTRLNLDDVSKRVLADQRVLREESTDSLVDDEATASSGKAKFEIDLKLGVLKHIIGVFKAEEASAKDAKKSRQDRKDLLELLHVAENAERLTWSKDQIREKIALLDAAGE